jgi:HPt (histidine-containing phosphotransfer) domain-containing protein
MLNLDRLTMHQMFDGLPPSTVARLVNTFEDDLVQLLQELKQAHREGDPQKIRFAAHSLAGVAASFGATQLEAMARRLLRPADGSDADRLEAITDVALAARQEIRQAFSV